MSHVDLPITRLVGRFIRSSHHLIDKSLPEIQGSPYTVGVSLAMVRQQLEGKRRPSFFSETTLP